jgi:hypothetical protein
MEWLLVLLAVGGGGAAWRGLRHRGVRRAAQAEEREELEAVRRLADEDVTVLGEQLRLLDERTTGRPLDELARTDYQTALDAYESAQRAAPRIRKAAEVSTITDTLSTGRYAMACVVARAEGRPLPELRVPCFFNPQHGPSVTDVLWTAPGRGTRQVPACARDAARVAADEAPEVRTVRIGGRTVPYWQAGDAFLPYTEGYFAGAAMTGWAWQSVDPGGWTDWGGSAGHGGFDGGGFGGGGVDGGGFDGGGGGGGGD